MLRKISSVHLFSAKALEDFKHVRQVKTFFSFPNATSRIDITHVVSMFTISLLFIKKKKRIVDKKKKKEE